LPELLLADIFIHTGDYSLALDIVGQVTKSVEKEQQPTGQCAYMQGLCMINLGREHEALKIWEKVPRCSVYYLRTLTWLYFLAWKIRNHEKAEEILKNICETDTGLAEAYVEVHEITFNKKGTEVSDRAKEVLTELQRRLKLLVQVSY